MALVVKDRVKVRSSTTGTGTLTLGTAFAGFQTFNNALGDGDTTYYGIFESSTGEFEVGIGTFTSSGNTLSRDTVLESSNTGAKVNLTADTEVFITYPAEKSVYFDANGDVTLTRDPQSALQAATKQYVDTIAAAGLHYHAPVRVQTTANLTATYNNGSSGVGATLTNSGTQAAISIDNITLSSADRVLVSEQTNAAHNGVYTVTNVGSASTNWVLTRATDADSYGPSDPDALGEGDAFFIKEGDTNAGHLDVMTTSGTITFGTTNIVFSEVAETTVYSAGNGLSLSGTEFNVGAGTGISIDATTVNTVQDIATSATPQFDGLTTTGNITFGDNDKAIFGAGSDLQIYHDGSNSEIINTSSGHFLLGSASRIILAKNPFEYMANFQSDGAATLYYDNSAKFATTSTGIDVTGTVTADGLTVDGLAKIQGSATGLVLNETDTTDLNTYFNNNGGVLKLFTANDAFSSFTERLRVDHSTGDISFYEDTGTTVRFFWDASTENLGIRTASPVTPLHVSGGSATRADIQITTSATGEGAGDGFQIGYIDSLGAFNWNYENSDWYVGTNNNRRLTINGSGQVGIGTSSPSSYHANADNLVIQDSGNAGITIATTDSAYFSQINFADGTSGAQAYTGILRYAHSDNSLRIIVNTGEKMRISSGGVLSVGNTAPKTWNSNSTGVIQFGGVGALENYNASDDPVILSANQYRASDGNFKYIETNEASRISLYAGDVKVQTAPSGTADTNATFTERLTIKNTGNIGIGTTSPVVPLNIEAAGSTSAGENTHLRINDTTNMAAGVGGVIQLSGEADSGGTTQYTFATIKGIKENGTTGNYDGALTFSTRTNGVSPAAEQMRITSSGSVGIGTSSPSTTLHVKSSGFGDLYQLMLDDGSGNAGLEIGTYGSVGQISGSTGLDFELNKSLAMRITSDGEVAINKTTVPNDSGSGYKSLLISNEATSKSARFVAMGAASAYTSYSALTSGTHNGTTFYSPALLYTDSLRFFSAPLDNEPDDTNLTERMRINSSGNVGIGTSSPASKLNVYSGTDPAIIAASDDWGEQLEIHRANSSVNWPSIKFTNSSGELGRVFVDASNDYLMYVKAGGSNYETVWTNLTDGSGSGLDADLLDGLQASRLGPTYEILNTGSSAQWVKLGNFAAAQTGISCLINVVTNSGYNASDAQNSQTVIRFKTSNNSSNQSGFYGDVQAYKTGPNAYPSIVRVVQVSTTSFDIWCYFGTYTGDGSFYTVHQTDGTWTHSNSSGTPSGTYIDATINTMWHSGNDGSGSTLDADLLDGVEGSSYLRSDADDTFTGTLTITGQATASSYFSTANYYINDSIIHNGDGDTYINFGTDTITLATGGSAEVTINTTGVRLGDTGNGYFQPVSGNYGSIQIDGGAHGGWEGYSIGGLAVFMTDSSTYFGLYNDSNNHWGILHVFNGATFIYHAGSAKLETTSGGVAVTGALTATGDITAYYSDERLKNFEGKIDGALDKVSQLSGYYFRENDKAKELGFDNDDRQVGVSAQEVEAVLPEVIKPAPVDPEYKTVQYEKLVPLLIEAIKELKEEVRQLKEDKA